MEEEAGVRCFCWETRTGNTSSCLQEAVRFVEKPHCGHGLLFGADLGGHCTASLRVRSGEGLVFKVTRSLVD